MRDSFIFYKSFYDSIHRIKSKELKADIFEAICELALNNNDIELTDDVGLMIMDLIKPQILANNKRYEDGKKGGRPKKTNGYKELKTGGYENKKPNVNVNDNENVNVNVNDNADDIYSYTQQQFGRMLSPAEIELIQKWEDNELTRYAIKQTALARATSLKYTQAILNQYKMNNITSVLEAEKQEKKIKTKDKGIKPEWLNKDYNEKNERELNDRAKEIIRTIRESDKREKANKDNNV